jgi:hypothetical protein
VRLAISLAPAGCRNCTGVPVYSTENRNQTSIHKAAHGRTSSLTGPSVNPPCPTPQPPRPRIRPRRRSTLNNFSSLLRRSHSCKTLNSMRSCTKILSLQSQIPLGSVGTPSLLFSSSAYTLLPLFGSTLFSFCSKKISSKGPSRKACMHFLSFWKDSLQRDSAMSGRYLSNSAFQVS